MQTGRGQRMDRRQVAATLQTDRQIKELSVENNDCALLGHVKDLISVLLVNLT